MIHTFTDVEGVASKSGYPLPNVLVSAALQFLTSEI